MNNDNSYQIHFFLSIRFTKYSARQPLLVIMESSNEFTLPILLAGKSAWGFFLTVPICLILIVYFSDLRSENWDRQAAVEALKPAWYTPKTARGDDLANKSMVEIQRQQKKKKHTRELRRH